MEITHEILAAYADGTLPESMLPEVRQYLATHPQELDQVLLLMDTEHPNLETEDQSLFAAAGVALGMTPSLLSMSVAAFVPPTKQQKKTPSVRKMNIQSNLTDLLNDLI